MHEESKEYFKNGLKNSEPQKIVVFQNNLDPFGSFRIVSNFVKMINPKIEIIEKISTEHNYPYYEDFKRFLR